MTYYYDEFDKQHSEYKNILQKISTIHPMTEKSRPIKEEISMKNEKQGKKKKQNIKYYNHKKEKND